MVARFKSRRRAPQNEEPKTGGAEVPPAGNRLLLFIPEAGFSFRLVAFPAVEPAQAYIREHALVLAQEEIVALWVVDSESMRRGLTSDEPLHAVVVIRDPKRPGVVQLYTFVDTDAAHSFLRDWATRGLDLGLVLVHWAALVTLNGSPAAPDGTPAGRTSVGPTADPPGPALSASAPQAHSSARDRPADEGRGRARRGQEAKAPPIDTEATAPDKRSQPGSEREEPERAPAPLVRLLRQVHSWRGWDGLAVRMVAASLLKQEVYEELKRDPQATGRAVLIVGLGALAAGIGGAGSGLASVFWHTAAAVPGWGAYAGTLYLVGIWLFGGRRARRVTLLQAVGLASSPSLLLVFAAVPVYGPLLALAVSVWVLTATATAIAPVLELDRESALLTAVVGWFPLFAISQVAPALLVS